MIEGLTREQFLQLPLWAIKIACQNCGKRGGLRFLVVCTDSDDGIYNAEYVCLKCQRKMTQEQYEQYMEDDAYCNEAQLLRRVSKKTVQELAASMGVSRQVYHRWLVGGGMSDAHKEKLQNMIIQSRLQ